MRKQDGKMWRLAAFSTYTGKGKDRRSKGDGAGLLGAASMIPGRLEQSG